MPTPPVALSAVANLAGTSITITYSVPVIVPAANQYFIQPDNNLSGALGASATQVFTPVSPLVGPVYPFLNYDGTTGTTVDASDPTNKLATIHALQITGPAVPPAIQPVLAGVPTLIRLYRVWSKAFAPNAPYSRFQVLSGMPQYVFQGVCGFPASSPFNLGYELSAHPAVYPFAAFYDLTFLAPAGAASEHIQVTMVTRHFAGTGSNQSAYIADVMIGGTPPPPTPPDPPYGVGVCEGAQVSLFISPYAGAITFDIYRNGVLLVNDTPTPFYVDLTALVGVTYSYTATVTTLGGTSAQSAPFVVTPCAVGNTWIFNPEPPIPAPPPGPPGPPPSPWEEDCSGDLLDWTKVCSGEALPWARVQVGY